MNAARLLIDARIAIQNLARRRRRDWLLGAALAAVAGLFVLQRAVLAGVRETILRTATTLVAGDVNVGGFFKAGAGQALPVLSRYGDVLAQVRAQVPEMQFAVVRGRGWAKVVSANGSMRLGLSGVDIADEPGLREALTLTSGRLEDLARPNTLLVFEEQRRRLAVDVGDAVTLAVETASGAINTVDCQIVAVARDAGLLSRGLVFVPNQTLRALYRLNTAAAGAIQIHLRPEHQAQARFVAGRLRAALAQAGWPVLNAEEQPFWMKLQRVNRENWIGQRLDVSTWEDEVAATRSTLLMLDGLSLILTGLLLAIIIVGVTNTLWVAAQERTREIGTLRAIGMSEAGVCRLFLLESFLLGAMGASVGAALGAAASAILNLARLHVPRSGQVFLMSDHLRLLVRPPELLTAVLLVTVVAMLAGLLPSLRAARMPPVMSLSHFE